MTVFGARDERIIVQLETELVCILSISSFVGDVVQISNNVHRPDRVARWWILQIGERRLELNVVCYVRYLCTCEFIVD